MASGISDNVFMAIETNGRYIGPVIGETSLHVIQDLGRRSVVIHDKTKLDKVPEVGQKLSINYVGSGRAAVEIRSAQSGRDR
jgi:putative DNA primase/helicase